MSKKITRDDVAKLAGVSPAVVSYVINQTKYVSEEKTLAVKKAIEELQYRPNLHARSLKTNKSMQIAFVCDNLRNNWLEIAEKKFFDRGYFVSHCYSRDGDEFIQMLIEGRFDGVFMLSNRYTAAQLNQIAGAGIPVVLYKTQYRGGCPGYLQRGGKDGELSGVSGPQADHPRASPALQHEHG